METKMIPFQNRLNTIAVSNQGTHFVIAGENFAATFAYPSLAMICSSNQDETFNSSIISPTDSHVFLANWKGNGVSIFELLTLKYIGYFSTNGRIVYSLAFSQNSLFYGSVDGIISKYNFHENATKGTNTEHTSIIYALVVAKEGGVVYSGSADRQVICHLISDLSSLFVILVPENIFSLCLSLDERTIFCGGVRSVFEFDLGRKSLFRTFENCHLGAIRKLIMTADGKDLVSCGADGTVNFLISQKPKMKLHMDWINDMAILNNNSIITVSADKKISVVPFKIEALPDDDKKKEVNLIKTHLVNMIDELKELTPKNLSFDVLKNHIASLFEKYSKLFAIDKYISGAPFFKGVLDNFKESGLCIRAKNSHQLEKGNFDKGLKNGKSTFIFKDHMIKANMTEGKHNESELMLKIFRPGPKIFGNCEQKNFNLLESFEVKRAVFENYTINFVYKSPKSPKNLSGEGKLVFNNGTIEGEISEGKLAISERNQSRKIDFEGETFYIKDIGIKGVIYTECGQILAIDYNKGFIMRQDVSNPFLMIN